MRGCLRTAAVLGFTMIYKDIIGKPLPKWVNVGHGIIAILGFLVLILAILDY